PTCVGLTASSGRTPLGTPVHPHVRGAHNVVGGWHTGDPGPSPRAWGSLGNTESGSKSSRSIPTCVGLTRSGTWSRPRRSVHPHVRGAHQLAALEATRFVGPSPRAWGSRGGVDDTHEEGPVHPHVRGAHNL